MVTRSHKDAKPNPSNDAEFWQRFTKAGLIMIPILVLLLYLTFRDVKKTEKPNTENSRQQVISE